MEVMRVCVYGKQPMLSQQYMGVVLDDATPSIMLSGGGGGSGDGSAV